jgi:hypothetical protein
MAEEKDNLPATYQAPATTGAFYFFNHLQSNPKGFQRLVAIPRQIH